MGSRPFDLPWPRVLRLIGAQMGCTYGRQRSLQLRPNSAASCSRLFDTVSTRRNISFERSSRPQGKFAEPDRSARIPAMRSAAASSACDPGGHPAGRGSLTTSTLNVRRKFRCCDKHCPLVWLSSSGRR
jgi:hypothetical protein